MKTTTAIKTAINTYVPTQVGTLALAAQGEGVPVVMWPSVFVGCSWGGQVTAHVAARHPQRTQAALLANT